MLSRGEKNKRAPATAKADVDYLLTTKLFCGLCERMMIGESGTSHTGDKHFPHIPLFWKQAGCQALLHSYKRRSGEMKVRQRQRKSDPYICALTLPASLSHVFAVITYKNSAGHSRNFGKRIDKIGVVIFQPDFHVQLN